MRGHTRDAHALLGSAGVGRCRWNPATSCSLRPRPWAWPGVKAIWLLLQRGWSRAREALLRHPVDLYVLLPLGELAVAAARLQEQWWIEPHLHQAEVLLAGLGQPVLWRVPLHWYGMHAAIAGESPEEARRHVSVLAELRGGRPVRRRARRGRRVLDAGAGRHGGRGCRGRNRAPACRGGLRRGGRPAGGTRLRSAPPTAKP